LPIPAMGTIIFIMFFLILNTDLFMTKFIQSTSGVL
jgi:hypothetical protein